MSQLIDVCAQQLIDYVNRLNRQVELTTQDVELPDDVLIIQYSDGQGHLLCEIIYDHNAHTRYRIREDYLGAV